MTNDEVTTLPHGLFILHWKEEKGGGHSHASVGSDRHGRRWFAATNWIEVPWFDWSAVERAEPVRTHR